MDTVRENNLDLVTSALGTQGYVRIVGSADGKSYRMAIQDFIDLCAENESFGELIKRSRVHIGTTTTGPALSEKIVACDDFEAIDGAVVAVTFSQRNTAGDAKLNINGTGAHAIYSTGGDSGTEWLRAVGTYLFVYRSASGGRYRLVGAVERIPSDDMPLMDATAGAAGTSLEYSRADHVHPRDTGLVEAIEDEAQARAEADTALDERVDAAEGDITDLKADLDEIETALETKAEIDGYYEEMTVGDAEQLVSTQFIEDSVPYLYRTSGGSADIGNREYDEIVGGSIVWNQLFDSVDYTSTKTDTQANLQLMVQGLNPVTTLFLINVTNTGRFAIILNSTTTCETVRVKHNGKSQDMVFATSSNAVFANHKYLLSAYFSGIDVTTVGGVVGKNFMLIDLTQMLGSSVADYLYSLDSATAGAGIAKLKSWGFLQKDYYEYNAGSMEHVSGISAHEMVGFNQWDEEWEIGQISSSDGSWVSAQYAIRSKNYIPVFPDTTYYITISAEVIIWGYDENHNAVRRLKWGTSGTFNTTGDSPIRYIRFATTGSAYGATYKNDICINLHWSGTRDGEYEPYVKHSYALDPTVTLRGIPKTDASGNLYYDGDIWHPDGTIERRYRQVTLDGTESGWNKSSTYNGSFYLSFDSSVAVKAHGSCMSDKLITVYSMSDYREGTIYQETSSINFWFSGMSGKTLAEFKSYLASNPITVVYELATPTTEEGTPYRSLQKVDPYGTEEYVSASLVPVGHYTKYPENLRAKIEGLPWDLSMIAPIETGTTASQAYAVGKYFLLNNKFCKAKTAIASGATFTLGTNYEVTTVSDELYTALNI